MNLILQVFYSIFSGATLALAIPNELTLFGCPFYSFFAIIPLYINIRFLCKSYRQAFWTTFIQVLTCHLLSSYWLTYFKDFAIFTLGGSALGTAFIGAFMGLFLYLPYSRKSYEKLEIYAAKKPFYDHTYFRVLYFAFIYTLYEWVKSSGFLGYPWGTISSTMYRFSLFTQLAAITGTYGITFLTVLFNGIAGEFLLYLGYSLNASKKMPLLNEIKELAAVFILLFACALVYGYYQLSYDWKPIKKITTIMVQQNCDPWTQNNDNDTILKSQTLTKKAIEELKDEGKKPQLIVWSEGSLQKMFPNAYNHYKNYPEEAPFIDFLKQIKTPLITGGSYVEEDEDTGIRYYYNAALLFDSTGTKRGEYAKLHLVPFAESIPGINNPKIKAIMMKIVGISAGWSQGKQLSYFDIPCSHYDKSDPYTPGIKVTDISIPYSTYKDISKKYSPTVRISTPICFDDSFTDVMRPLFLNGSELFVNITDDSWSRTKSSEVQHFVIASYRSIEYRTTLLRSTNAGYSVVLSPTGKILADQPMFEDYSIGVDVPIYERRITTYAKYGNWLPYLCIIILFLTSMMMHQSFTKTDYIPGTKKIRKDRISSKDKE